MGKFISNIQVKARRVVRAVKSFYKGRRKLAGASVASVILLVMIVSGLMIRQSAAAKTDANIVILNYDNQRRTVPTTVPTVGKLVQKLGIKINQGDVVEPSLKAKISESNFRINIYRAKPVEIVDGYHKVYIFTAATSPRTVAKQAKVSIYPEDNLVRTPADDFTSDYTVGDKIVVNRATPVKLMVYGHESALRTQTETVGDLLKDKKITLNKGDTLEPSANTPIKPGLTIAINHKGTKYVTKNETIPMPIKYVADASLSIGTSATRQQGSDGESETTYMITMKNGVEVKRKVVQKIITKQPVEAIVARGTAMVPISGSHSQWMSRAGISAQDQPYADFIISHESGWNVGSLSGSGCAGLGQACPGGKLARACPSWQTDPVCQLKFFNGYAQGKGGWHNAYLFKRNNGWW